MFAVLIAPFKYFHSAPFVPLTAQSCIVYGCVYINNPTPHKVYLTSPLV